MESTFIIKKEDFNSEFVEAVKKLFSKSHQLQITINSSKDFNLLKPETPAQYLNRLKKAHDIEKKKNLASGSETGPDKMALSKENKLLYEMSNASFENAYGDDESEYSFDDIKTVNPDYEGR